MTTQVRDDTFSRLTNYRDQVKMFLNWLLIINYKLLILRMSIYLDNAGTKKPDEKIANEYYKLINKSFGNSSSLHSHGREISKILENCRETVANIFSVEPEMVYFNSGASEGNNTVLKGMVDYALYYKIFKKKLPHLIISSVEHPSIIETANTLQALKRATITYINPNEDGIINTKQIIENIIPETILVSIGLVNNETGIAQKIKTIGREIKKFKISHKTNYPFYHSDITQAIEYFNVDLEKDLIDIVTFSGHKFGSLPGCGVMISRADKFLPLIDGGGQEMSKRSGTVDIYGILFLTKILEKIVKNREKISKNIIKKIIRMERKIKKIKGAQILFELSPRSPHISLVSLKGVDHQELFVLLDRENISISIGSACASKSQKISYVLKNIGIDETTIKSTLRISIASATSNEEIDQFVKTLAKIYENY